MKILTSDKPLNKVGIVSSDASLCKIKVKPTRDNNNTTDSRKPENNNDNNYDNDVQRYVVASKKRAVVLQFQSPIQRKKNLKKSKLGKGSNHPQGAVQGIKNLTPVNPARPMERTFVDKKRTGPKALEGTYIEFFENEKNDETISINSRAYEKNGESGSIKTEAHDKIVTNVSIETEKDIEEEAQIETEMDAETEVEDDDFSLELEKDDNYYNHFLKSIQCSAKVKQIKCGSIADQRDDVFFTNEFVQDFPMFNRSKSRKKKIRSDRSKSKISVEASGARVMKEISKLFDGTGFNKDIFNVESEDNQISLQSDDDFDFDENVHSNHETSHNQGDVWTLDNLLAGLMNINTCGEEFGVDCGDFECDDKDGWDLMKPRENGDDTSEVSIDPPTALYAAIGAQNWNVALRRLVEAPEEAREWVCSGTSEEGTVIQFLPIHLVCLTNAPLLLAALLVQAYPESLMEDGMGKLPIHMACQAQVDHRIVFLLSNRYQESLQIEDDEGNTPIEIASLSESSNERSKIIQVLTKKWKTKLLQHLHSYTMP